MRDELGAAWLHWFRRHERRLTALWLGGAALVLLLLALAPFRERLLDRLGHLVDRWEDRWAGEVTRGEALLRAGRYDAAAAWFERLDARHPARDVRHGRDKERELVLRLLAHSYEGQGKPNRAMSTWRRLVAFDSLNYTNRFAYAQAAERLLSGWALAEEARDGYASVLRIFPVHLPSVRGYIDYYMDRGEFIPVTEAYRAYLDAFFLHTLEVGIGEVRGQASVLVDGLPREVEIPMVAPAGEAAELVIRPGGFALRVEAIEVVPARRAGVVGPLRAVALDPSALRPAGMTGQAGGWLPADSAASLSISVPPQSGGISRVRLRVTLFKPVDAGLWALVEKSFRNLLDAGGLSVAASRTLPFPDAERADRVITDLPWAREGIEAARRDQF